MVFALPIPLKNVNFPPSLLGLAFFPGVPFGPPGDSFDFLSGVFDKVDLYGFGDYHSYETILKYLDDVANAYPAIARTFIAGTSAEGRPIKGIKIGNPINSATKRSVWIDGGIHAREWAAVHTVLWFVNQLISTYETDSETRQFVDGLQFYLLPVVNPDGYEFSRDDITPMHRLWRKNRGGIRCKLDRWFRERCCGGVDLNRNFDFHWAESGSSTDRCSEVYQGDTAFSEPESRAVRDMLLSPELKGRTDAFITLHTYAQMWIHPYSNQVRTYPEDVQDLREVGLNGVAALERDYGTAYRFGTGADILYPSSGGSDDWAKGVAGVKYVYLLELRPADEVWDGFLLDPRQLIPTGKETWDGIKPHNSALTDRRGVPLGYREIPMFAGSLQSTCDATAREAAVSADGAACVSFLMLVPSGSESK
ncbi:unnamed protein product, partial [Mesorhabditis spiculigera]